MMGRDYSEGEFKECYRGERPVGLAWKKGTVTILLRRKPEELPRDSLANYYGLSSRGVRFVTHTVGRWNGTERNRNVNDLLNIIEVELLAA